jgi:hypothetical protein
MRLENPEYSMLVGIQQLNSLKAKETLLPCFVLSEHRDNGKLS